MLQLKNPLAHSAENKRAIEIFINSFCPLGFAKSELEDDIEDLLGDFGEVTGGGSGRAGWNIDIEIFNNENLDQFQQKIIKLLRNRDVPSDTYLQIVGKGDVKVYQ
jgi:hypothetical protein